jgi:hypothetical protein
MLTIKNKLIILITLFSISLSFADEGGKGGKKKKVADLKGLEGSYFGTTEYGGEKRRASLLLTPIAGEEINYYAVAMEYLNPWKEEKFIKNFLRAGKGKNGAYLKELLEWSTIVKLVGDEKTGSFKAYAVSIQDNKLVADTSSDVGDLTPRAKKKEKKRIKRSTMNLTIGDRKLSIYFNKRNNRFLKSSWEEQLQAGPYNPGYKESGIRILHLLEDYHAKTNTRTAKFDVTQLKDKDIRIRGEYLITNEDKGVYIFKDITKNEDAEGRFQQISIGKEHIEGKVGVFVDIYNAQPIMNTVELILIDPSNPYGAQMYFEEFGNKN